MEYIKRDMLSQRRQRSQSLDRGRSQFVDRSEELIFSEPKPKIPPPPTSAGIKALAVSSPEKKDVESFSSLPVIIADPVIKLRRSRSGDSSDKSLKSFTSLRSDRSERDRRSDRDHRSGRDKESERGSERGSRSERNKGSERGGDRDEKRAGEERKSQRSRRPRSPKPSKTSAEDKESLIKVLSGYVGEIGVEMIQKLMAQKSARDEFLSATQESQDKRHVHHDRSTPMKSIVAIMNHPAVKNIIQSVY